MFDLPGDDVVYGDWVDGAAVYAVGVTHGAFTGSTHLGSGDAFVTRIDLP